MKRKKPEDAGRSPRRAQELLHNARLGADTSPAAGHEPAENEAPFRSLSEQSLVGAYVLRDEHLSYVNPALARMCGYERAELTGAHFSRVIHPDDVALVAENLRRRVNGETGAQRYECRGVRKDGLTVFIEILGAAGAKVDGTLVTFGNILDITERKRAENELRESRALLASAFDKSPLLMSISDLSTGKYREVNESFCAVSGFGREEVIGRTSLELGWVSAEGRARMMDELRRTEKVTGMELGLRRKDGREIFARYWGDVIRSAEGDTLFSAAEDITERRRAEALAKELQSHQFGCGCRRRTGQLRNAWGAGPA